MKKAATAINPGCSDAAWCLRLRRGAAAEESAAHRLPIK